MSVSSGGGGYDPSFPVTFTGGGSPTVAAAATATATGSLMASGTPAMTKVLTGSQTAGECSPVSEFVTGGGADLLFVGSGKTAATAFGQVQSLNVTDGTLNAAFTTLAQPSALGGTSGIIVDNISNAAQASSIYFGTLAQGTHAVNIASATRAGTTATITTQGPHNLWTGQSVTVAGVGGNANFNITATITVTGATTFTYTMAASGGSGTVNTGTASVTSFLAIKLTQVGLN